MTARALLGRLLLAFTLAPAAAVAAQSPHTVEIGGFARNTWFDDQLPVDEKVGGGATIGVFVLRNFAIEAEGSYLKSNGPLGNDISNTRILGRLVYNVPLGGYANAFQIGAGYVRNMYGKTADADENGVHVLVGLRVGFTENIALRVAGTVDAIPTPKLVPATVDNYNKGVQAGLSLLFGNSYDRDKDGVKDKADKCPGTPAGEEADASGCSASQRDSDGDKVMDNADKCPNTPAGESVDAEGCSAAQKDADGDKVMNTDDRCPSTPAGEEVDASGCSASQRDSDGDKVMDNADKCPNTPAGESVNADGCSSTQLDDDKDGVPNAADACPGTEAGTAVDQRGCPALFKGPERTVILKGVNFQFNRAKLTPDSRDTLMEVAKSLAGSPDVHVEVAGYTDSQGNSAYNQRLSQRRAEEVQKFLVANGVSPAQLTAHGYGESKPVAPNKTASGRAQNRRVELNRTN
jgi:outer membrane protein OmpA-like peptidoglycan-associated protein